MPFLALVVIGWQFLEGTTRHVLQEGGASTTRSTADKTSFTGSKSTFTAGRSEAKEPHLSQEETAGKIVGEDGEGA